MNAFKLTLLAGLLATGAILAGCSGAPEDASANQSASADTGLSYAQLEPITSADRTQLESALDALDATPACKAARKAAQQYAPTEYNQDGGWLPQDSRITGPIDQAFTQFAASRGGNKSFQEGAEVKGQPQTRTRTNNNGGLGAPTTFNETDYDFTIDFGLFKRVHVAFTSDQYVTPSGNNAALGTLTPMHWSEDAWNATHEGMVETKPCALATIGWALVDGDFYIGDLRTNKYYGPIFHDAKLEKVTKSMAGQLSGMLSDH